MPGAEVLLVPLGLFAASNSFLRYTRPPYCTLPWDHLHLYGNARIHSILTPHAPTCLFRKTRGARPAMDLDGGQTPEDASTSELISPIGESIKSQSFWFLCLFSFFFTRHVRRSMLVVGSGHFNPFRQSLCLNANPCPAFFCHPTTQHGHTLITHFHVKKAWDSCYSNGFSSGLVAATPSFSPLICVMAPPSCLIPNPHFATSRYCSLQHYFPMFSLLGASSSMRVSRRYDVVSRETICFVAAPI